MQPDLEYLIWLYSIGVEEFLNEVPVNQFGEEHQDDFMNTVSKNSISKEYSIGKGYYMYLMFELYSTFELWGY